MDELIGTMLGFGAVVRPYMASEIGKVISAAGVTDRDLNILEFVAAKGRVRFGEIADRLQLDHKRGTSTSRLSTAVAALYGKHGLLKKEVSPEDQRQPIISVTPKGRRLLERVSEVRTQVYEDIHAAMALNASDAAKLKDVFERGARNFERFLAEKRHVPAGRP